MQTALRAPAAAIRVPPPWPAISSVWPTCVRTAIFTDRADLPARLVAAAATGVPSSDNPAAARPPLRTMSLREIPCSSKSLASKRSTSLIRCSSLLACGESFSRARRFQKSIGGSPTNVAVAAARLGRRSAVFTKVGDDGLGRYVRIALAEEFGVDARFVGTH